MDIRQAKTTDGFSNLSSAQLCSIFVRHKLLQYLAIVNNASINMGVDVSFQISVLFSLNKYPEMKFLDHGVVLFLIF